jgi:capsular polysaccharide transport system permease protein
MNASIDPDSLREADAGRKLEGSPGRKGRAKELRVTRERALDRNLRGADLDASAATIDWTHVSRRRRLSFAIRLFLFVVLPTASVAAYMFLYATPRYVSELELTYQTDSSNAKPISGGGMLASLLAPTVSADISSIIAAYLTSSAALDAVEDKLQFRKHYSDPKIDYLSRLSSTPDTATLLRYYASRVVVSQQLGGYVTVDVEAYSAKYAQEVGQVLADECDKMFSSMTDQSRADQVEFAQKILADREERLRQATASMVNFRNLNRNFDPSVDATQLGAVVGNLEQQLSLARSDLANSQKFLQEGSPTIVAQKAKVEALIQQIGIEKNRLANPGGNSDVPYSKRIADYLVYTQQLQFATDSYTSAKQTLDLATAEAARKTQYVLLFVPPNLPVGASWADAIKYTLSVFLVSLFLYATGTLLLGALKDRAGV